MRRALAVLSLLGVLIVGCGSPATRAPTSARPIATQAVRATPVPVAGCQPASAGLMAELTRGIDVVGGGSFRNGHTVKSSDYAKVWFVGAEITGEGITPGSAVGIWATDDLNGSGLIYGIDGFAHEFSSWGDGTKIAAAMSMFDDGAQEAKACAGG